MTGARASEPTPGWQTWLRYSRAARRVSAVLAVIDVVALATAVVIIVALLLRGRPVAGLTPLIVAAIPTVALGQLWTIALITARNPPRRRRGWAGLTLLPGWRSGALRNPVKLFFGDLPTSIAAPIMTLAVLGWVSAMTTIPSIAGGGPAARSADCAYRISNHGAFRCVSRSVYERAGAGEQRFAASILLAFFCIHLGAALGQRRGRDDHGDVPAARTT